MNYSKILGKFLLVLFLLVLPIHKTDDPEHKNCSDWPLWQAYLQKFVQDDGRVIDYRIDQGITTSEGQAYSLFFALVANDKRRFEVLLDWIANNLASGDLKHKLPAWYWGRKPTGDWGILDTNPASDADLWLAYTLLQAAALWHKPDYSTLGYAILKHINQEAVITLPKLGPMLLPASRGFNPEANKWIINPSYMPIQLLRALNKADPAGPWNRIADNTLHLMQHAVSHGLAPDWIIYESGKGWLMDPVKGPFGSYDAIRVYLWAGMLDDGEPLKKPLLQALTGIYTILADGTETPPEQVNVATGETMGAGSAGFSAALLPYLAAMSSPKLIEDQLRRISSKSNGHLIGEHPDYYDQVLALFGQGWLEKRFRFDRYGQLIPNWLNQCPP